ncbi:MAG: 4-(cytidine 5'-diphospho)-2-C-methyl-D-erythritol kinase [Clostridia bacterium]|nr:4-(cytidine 5'-diphospho)-2-C-methyl-D-erythritol kinase [Clostridia bacterium]MBN2883150.1 4-(cytidine 5'-diphospho)-2-C-methyl-D-erythritol kinase [Clostridia bacterium]
MIIEKAFAKINIGLNIVGKRDDGYHDIDTIMQTIALHDVIRLKKRDCGITVFCDNPLIPVNEKNTAYQAARVFLARAGLDINSNGVTIEIQKNIPSEAGLGGGSSDAAAVLRAMNKLFCTKYGTSELIELALEIGSDVPFLVEGGTARAMGRGEIMVKMNDFANINTVIAMPGEGISTAEAYSLYVNCRNPLHPDIDSISKHMDSLKLMLLSGSIGNTFESLIFPVKPIIEKTKHDILETNPLACSLTGSGSAVYGIYDSEKAAQKAYEQLSEKYNAYITKTMGGVN